MAKTQEQRSIVVLAVLVTQINNVSYIERHAGPVGRLTTLKWYA